MTSSEDRSANVESLPPMPSRRGSGEQHRYWLAAAALALLATSVAVTAGRRQDQTTPTGSTATRETPDAVSPEQDPDEFARVGEAMTGQLCAVSCHGWDQVFVMRRSARDWDITIDEMVDRGVAGTTDQVTLVRRYLTWSYGLVSINSAPAAELSAVLGVSMKDAEHIVAYREAHGKFADMAALLAVPGLDKEPIEAQTGALLFN